MKKIFEFILDSILKIKDGVLPALATIGLIATGIFGILMGVTENTDYILGIVLSAVMTFLVLNIFLIKSDMEYTNFLIESVEKGK